MVMSPFVLHRATGLLDLAVAAQKKIVILGIGSVGSKVALQLAYPWRLAVYADPQNLEDKNIERHALGWPYLGQPKAVAMKDYVVTHKGVPADSIEACVETHDTVLARHTDADLVICNIDDLDVCHEVNEWCVRYDVPCIYTGVYERGKGGEVIVIPHPKDVCLICAERMNGVITEKPEHAHDYGVNPMKVKMTVDKKPVAVPALEKSVSAIALDAVEKAWELLFESTMEGGGEAHILFRGLHEWTEVVRLPVDGVQFKAALAFIGAFKLTDRGYMRLSKPVEGKSSLWIRRSSFALPVSKWDECPMHQAMHDVSEL